jgi:hypothetical protein
VSGVFESSQDAVDLNEVFLVQKERKTFSKDNNTPGQKYRLLTAPNSRKTQLSLSPVPGTLPAVPPS